MRIKLDPDLYSWLTKLGILKAIISREKAPSGKILMTEKESYFFETGILFRNLLLKICEICKFEIPTISILREENNGHSRAYNWNILFVEYQNIQINFDTITRSKLFTADPLIYNEILRDIYEISVLKLDHLSLLETTSQKSQSSQNKTLKFISKEVSVKPETVNLALVDPQKNIEEVNNLLEFLILLLCKHLKLQPKQAAVLLGSNNKYMAHLFVKGLKGNFEPVRNLVQQVYVNVPTMLNLIVGDDVAIDIVLQTFKPSLISKDEEVSRWGCRLLSKLFFEFANRDGHAKAYEWFISDNGGLFTCILAFKRHFSIADSLSSLIVQAGRWNLREMFNLHLKRFFKEESEYFLFLRGIFPSLIMTKLITDELIEGGILRWWADQAFKIASNENRDSIETRQNSLAFLVDVWIETPMIFEDSDESILATSLLSLLKKATRESSVSLSIFSIIQQFKLLKGLAKGRNPWSPHIFKSLTFSFVENHADITLRELMLINFLEIFEDFSSIPIGVFMEPFLRQIQEFEGKTFTINLADLSFFNKVLKHSQLQIKTGLLALDVLSKLFLQKSLFSSIISDIIMIVLTRYSEEAAIQEYILKFIVICLNEIKESVFLNLKKTKTILESDFKILEAQKRAQIVELLKRIIKLEIPLLNEEILKSILQTSYELKIPYKGIEHLLSFFGNPYELMRNYKEKQIQNQKENEIEMNSIAKTQGFISADLGNYETDTARKDYSTFLEQNMDSANNLFEIPEISSEEKYQNDLKSKGIGFRKGKNKRAKEESSIGSYRAFKEIEAIKSKREEILSRDQQEKEFKMQKEILAIQKAREKVKQPTTSKIEAFPLEFEENWQIENYNIIFRKNLRFLKKLHMKFSQNEFSQLNDLVHLMAESGFDKHFGREKIVLAMKLCSNNNSGLDLNQFVRFLLTIQCNYEPEEDAGNLMKKIISKLKAKFPLLVDSVDEEVETLNNRLLTDPERALPPGFRKVAEKEIKMKDQFPPTLVSQIKESFSISTELLSNLIERLFGSSILETTSNLYFLTKAVRTERVSKIENIRRGRSAQRPLNNVEIERMKKAEEEAKQKEEQDKRIAKRKAELDIIKTRQREESSKRKEELSPLHKPELIQPNPFSEKKIREQAMKKEAIKEYKERLAKEAQQTKERISRENQVLEAQKKVEREIFLKEQSEKLKEQFEKKAKARKEEEEHLKLREEESKNLEAKEKTKIMKKLKEEKEKRNLEIEANENLKLFRQNPEISSIFQEFSKSLSYVHEFYTAKNAGLGNQTFGMLLKDFLAFCHLFALSTLLGQEELQTIYNHTLKNSETSFASLSDFEMCLIRVASKGQKTFDKLMNVTNGKDSIDGNTLLGLFRFMDLPKEKGLLINKLKGNPVRQASAKRETSEDIRKSEKTTKKIIGPDGKEENWEIKR